MSAEATGARLLSEVKEERLDETLRILRKIGGKTSSNRLNVKPLDRLLHIFQVPSVLPIAKVNPEWSSSPEESQALFQSNALQQRPAVIEITGTSSCSGKTHLLYYITALSILPFQFENEYIQGKEAAVVVFDLDNRFNIPRLKQVMKHHVYQCLRRHQDGILNEEEDANDSIEKLLDAALLHVHLFRPQSSTSWLSTIQSLTKYLLQSQGHFSIGRALSAVLVDSVSAFFWQDRQNEVAHQCEENPLSNPTTVFSEVYSAIVGELRDIQSRFDCTIVATNWGLMPLQQTRPNAPPSFKPHLPPVWTNFCTLRLIVERDSVAKFGPLLSAEEASRDADARQQKVEKGGFSAWVDSAWGNESWFDGARKSLKNVEGKGFIWFRITSDGVDMDFQ